MSGWIASDQNPSSPAEGQVTRFRLSGRRARRSGALWYSRKTRLTILPKSIVGTLSLGPGQSLLGAFEPSEPQCEVFSFIRAIASERQGGSDVLLPWGNL
jgi:hypothetical protein